MELKTRISSTLKAAGITDGDYFFCKRKSSSVVGKKFKYEDGFITDISGTLVKSSIVANLIKYHIFLKIKN